MVSITEMNLYAIDLNLLAVLHAVLEERSATRAARKLHVTQSAVSNALARLRQVLGDPLVVRSGRGIVPTPRGAELGPAIAAAMNQLDAAIDRGRGFVAAESTRTFTFAAADNTQVTDVPKIAALFAEELPQATLRVVSADYLVATDGLATGAVDATISPAALLPEGARTAPVLPERAALLVREGHPLSGQRVTPKMYASMGHIDIEIVLGRTGVGHKLAMDELRRLGLERNVVARVPYFTTAALIASKTDLVASVPAARRRDLRADAPSAHPGDGLPASPDADGARLARANPRRSGREVLPEPRLEGHHGRRGHSKLAIASRVTSSSFGPAKPSKTARWALSPKTSRRVA